jgi:hypothetical protein
MRLLPWALVLTVHELKVSLVFPGSNNLLIQIRSTVSCCKEVLTISSLTPRQAYPILTAQHEMASS